MLTCEKKLRQANNLNENNILTIVQVEIYSNNDKTLTNHVKLAIYDENKKKLNLSVCDNEEVRINYKTKKIDNIAEKINNYLNTDINLLNIESPNYNICSIQFIKNEDDLYLKNEILSLFACDINCEYESFNMINQTISCICSSLLDIESKIEEPPAIKKKNLALLLVL